VDWHRNNSTKLRKIYTLFTYMYINIIKYLTSTTPFKNLKPAFLINKQVSRAHNCATRVVELGFLAYVFKKWLGSRVAIVLDSGAEGVGFKSQPRRLRVTVLSKLFTSLVVVETEILRSWSRLFSRPLLIFISNVMLNAGTALCMCFKL